MRFTLAWRTDFYLLFYSEAFALNCPFAESSAKDNQTIGRDGSVPEQHRLSTSLSAGLRSTSYACGCPNFRPMRSSLRKCATHPETYKQADGRQNYRGGLRNSGHRHIVFGISLDIHPMQIGLDAPFRILRTMHIVKPHS